MIPVKINTTILNYTLNKEYFNFNDQVSCNTAASLYFRSTEFN